MHQYGSYFQICTKYDQNLEANQSVDNDKHLSNAIVTNTANVKDTPSKLVRFEPKPHTMQEEGKTTQTVFPKMTFS